MTNVYFVSDVHLQADNDALAISFQQWLIAHAPKAEAIYLLGDIFDAWLGDDLHQDYPQTTVALAQAGKQTQLYFMAGNHDFLLGDDYLLLTHMKKLPDPSVIEHFGERTLISHGDLLCTNDRSYQRFRRIIQHPITRWLFLKLPKSRRQKVAKQLQRNSRSQTEKKSSKAMDICPESVSAWKKKHAIKTFIHGHTHKPGYSTDHGIQRYVLGAWHDQANVLKLSLNLSGNKMLTKIESITII